MKQKWPVLLCLFFCATAFAQVDVQQLLVESQSNPVGVDVANPLFSWQLLSGKKNILQTAYEIKVALSLTGKSLVWTSGKVTSSESQQVMYAGPELQSAKKYYWQVRVWTNDNTASAWSAPAFWQMALMNLADWQAKWIQAGYKEDSIKKPNGFRKLSFFRGKMISCAGIQPGIFNY